MFKKGLEALKELNNYVQQTDNNDKKDKEREDREREERERKRKRNTLIWCIVGVLLLISGISNSITECKREKKEEENAKIEESKSANAYIAAVDSNNYKHAHEILNKLQADYIKRINNRGNSYDASDAREFWNAANYIYKAEMQYLLPMKDPEADQRLLYSLDNFTPVGEKPKLNFEYDKEVTDLDMYINFVTGFNTLCTEMVRIALRYNNVDFAKNVIFSMKENYIKNEVEGKHWMFIANNDAINDAKKLVNEYLENKGENAAYTITEDVKPIIIRKSETPASETEDTDTVEDYSEE